MGSGAVDVAFVTRKLGVGAGRRSEGDDEGCDTTTGMRAVTCDVACEEGADMGRVLEDGRARRGEATSSGVSVFGEATPSGIGVFPLLSATEADGIKLSVSL